MLKNTNVVTFFFIVVMLTCTTQAFANLPLKQWQSVATVKAIDPVQHTLTLRHADIPGLMPSMTMPFRIKNKSIYKNIEVGDQISFTFIRQPDYFTIVALSRLKKAEKVAVKSRGAFIKKIPWDYKVVDQHGKSTSLAEHRGKLMLVSFIYASCPSVCPLLTAKIQAMTTKHDAEQSQKLSVLTFTLDPNTDSPHKLNEYASSHGIKNKNWHFLTGDETTMKIIANSFNVISLAKRNGDYEHSSDLHLINKEGVLVKSYPGLNLDMTVIAKDIKTLL
jgi:protein SCO1/2